MLNAITALNDQTWAFFDNFILGYSISHILYTLRPIPYEYMYSIIDVLNLESI